MQNSIDTEDASGSSSQSKPRRFIHNVAWNWAGVLLSIFSGLILSRIFIRTLGPEEYGLWALSFSIIEYSWLFDLGFRAATVKMVAHYYARGEQDKVAGVINTALSYASLTALLILVGVFLSVGRIERFFNVSSEHRESFRTLLRLLTLNGCLGIVLNLFTVSLEAIQRFDLTGRIAIIVTAIRAIGTAVLLLNGYGLVAIAILTVVSQIVGYVLTYIRFHKVFTGIVLSVRSAKWAIFRELGQFGIHSFLANTSVILLSQSAPVMIGHYLSASSVGFYNLPTRLLATTVDFVGRVGLVTNTKAAELAAKQDLEALSFLAVYTNRYCLVIFMPLAIFLGVYRVGIFDWWVGPTVTPSSAPLLPVLLIGNVLAVVGQFSSSMLLLGMGRHQRYARGTVLETVSSFLLLIAVVPRYGLMGAAVTISVLMVLNRGFYAAWLVSRETKQGFLGYVRSIYFRPLLAAVPVLLLALLMQSTILPGSYWPQLPTAGAILGLAYYLLAMRFCLNPTHRQMLWLWGDKLRRRIAI